MRALVHDPWVMRRMAPLLRDADFGEAQVRGHAYTQTSDSDYMVTLVERRGADALAAEGRVTAATTDALKAEARARVAAGIFFGHIAYINASHAVAEHTDVEASGVRPARIPCHPRQIRPVSPPSTASSCPVT